MSEVINLINTAKQQGITTEELMQWFKTVENRATNTAQ